MASLSSASLLWPVNLLFSISAGISQRIGVFAMCRSLLSAIALYMMVGLGVLPPGSIPIILGGGSRHSPHRHMTFVLSIRFPYYVFWDEISRKLEGRNDRNHLDKMGWEILPSRHWKWCPLNSFSALVQGDVAPIGTWLTQHMILSGSLQLWTYWVDIGSDSHLITSLSLYILPSLLLFAPNRHFCLLAQGDWFTG